MRHDMFNSQTDNEINQAATNTPSLQLRINSQSRQLYRRVFFVLERFDRCLFLKLFDRNLCAKCCYVRHHFGLTMRCDDECTRQIALVQLFSLLAEEGFQWSER